MPRERASEWPSKVKFTSSTPWRSAPAPNAASAPCAAPLKRTQSSLLSFNDIASRPPSIRCNLPERIGRRVAIAMWGMAALGISRVFADGRRLKDWSSCLVEALKVVAVSKSGMPSGFTNVYADPMLAQAYATLECAGTYYLAVRDLPVLLRRYPPGGRALDFGCGTGRSTRFLK